MAPVEGRGQHVGISSLLLACGSQGSKLGLRLGGKRLFPLGLITSAFRVIEPVMSEIKVLEDSISGKAFLPSCCRGSSFCVSHMWLTEPAGSPPGSPLQGHMPMHGQLPSSPPHFPNSCASGLSSAMSWAGHLHSICSKELGADGCHKSYQSKGTNQGQDVEGGRGET